jgi:thiol-disulfide isomerase/thioredoxin
LSKLLSEYPVNSEHSGQYNVWSSLCEGKTREFVLFNFLKHSTKSKYISKYLSTFRNDYPFSLLGIHSLKKFEEYIINEPTNNKLLDEEMSCNNCLLNLDSKKAITWDSLINETGVVKYLDFWASWCGGCRASFDDVRKLQDEYKSQDFKVIFVSIDTLPVAWTKASEKEKLSDNENFLFLNFDESSVKVKYSIPPIARYMLIDKKGRVIAAEAPSPSSSELRVTINRLLSEK